MRRASARTTPLTVVAPGHRRARAARAVRRLRGRRPGVVDAAAPVVRDHRRRRPGATAARSPWSSPRTAPAPPGSPAGAPSDPSTSSARSAGRSRCRRAGVGAAGRRRLRHRAAAPARRRRCATAAAGSTSCSARPPPTGCSGALEAKRLASTVAVTTDDGSAGRARPGHPTSSPRCSGAPARTSSTPAARCRCCGRSRDLATAHGVPCAGRGRGVDGLRHRGVHDLRAAGRRRRRPDPDGPLLHRGAGLRRRPGALRRRRHGPARTVGAPPWRGGGHR